MIQINTYSANSERYSAKNKNRIRCVHPDCEAKRDVNFTYAGIMKHIIELHTSQETAVRADKHKNK